MVFRGQAKIASFFFLLMSAAFLFAGGSRDEVFVRADELINEKKYDEAVRILSDYIREHPDKFGDAQKRLQRILKLQDQFNSLAGDLLDVLAADPGNNEKILNISNQLRALGSVSDFSTQEFLDQVRVLAAFNHNRSRLEQILVDSRLLLEGGDFSGALAAYNSGLDIYQAEYFAAGYGEEAEQTVRQGLSVVGESSGAFEPLRFPFDQAVAALENFDGTNLSPGAVQAVYDTLVSGMRELSRARTNLVRVAEEFENQLWILQQEDPNLQDSSFLSFAGRLLRGPLDREREGMVGTLDRYWDLRVNAAESAVTGFVVQDYDAVLAAVNSGRYDELPPLIDTAQRFLAISEDFLRHWTAFYESTALPLVIFDEPVTPQKTGDFVKYRSINRALDFLRVAGDIGRRFRGVDASALSAWQEGSMNARVAISMEQAARETYNSLGTELAGLEEAIDSEIRNFDEYRELLLPLQNTPEDPFVYLNRAMTVARDLENRVREDGLNAFLRQYTIANGDLEGEVNRREEEFNEGNRLIDGIVTLIEQKEDEEDDREYISHYPSEGLEILNQMNQNLAQNLAAGLELLDQYNAEPDNIVAGAGQSLYNQAVFMTDRLRTLQARAAALSSTARTQIDRAAALRLEGDRLFQEAQAALRRNSFDLARDRLTLAQNRYSDSLAIQESEVLRAQDDARIVPLGQEIVRLENEFVVREVRDYITRARTSYFSGNFDQAEDLLLRAQNRWRTTNSTEEPEISYWLLMTRNALSITSGRVIPVTAPLYAEMSQLLSDAGLCYDEGVVLINANRRAEGLTKFDEARGMTQKVELMFPLNREARLLDLRIEQFMDPAAFNTSFRQRLNDAIAGTKPGVRSVESFADLQNLAEINPQYPRIAQILIQAEIDMNYRPSPPDPRALAESNSLTRQAQPIVESRNSGMYEVALTWLNQAIDLNPNNSDAPMLKDRLQILMTGTSLFAMDSRSYDEYVRAVNEFQRGNKYTAWTIVQELLQNPENRKSTQILDLQRRIEATL